MKKNNSHGFTLVEVLVAAMVITLSLVSVVAFVRKGNEQIMLDKHRRVARSIIENKLENERFNGKHFPNLVTGQNITTNTIDASPLITGSDTLIIAAPDQVVINGIPVPRRLITIKIGWTEPGNTTGESITLTKWVTQW